MKLRSLTLHGFKSFADRTELRFHEGITAIVGPNGCGKSNISDAIRWVLGEQRPSAIRGAKMEEAIFQGTLVRRAVNRAEVSLEFTNEAGRLSLPQSEVEIRRIVFREGGSDYQLNRQSTRLRDILDLCRDTGLGANAYAVIEQGMVDSILSDRADERRHLFEEAAGIGRYKDRRKASQRKLEAAETDLARLQDLVAEVESKVRSLARQRGRAQRYVALRERRLGLEVAVANAELFGVRAALAGTESRLEALTRDEPATRAELSGAEAQLERQRLESADTSRQRGAAAVELENVNRQIADRERERAVAEERRAHAERRLAQIAADRTELQARRAALAAEASSVESEHSGQAKVCEALASRVAEVQERQSRLREQVMDVRRIDEDARARETELTRRLARLEVEASSAETRASDAESRLERLGEEQNELETELGRLDEQGDLFAEQVRTLAARRDELADARARAEDALNARVAEEGAARRRLAESEDEANRLAAKVEALEVLERDYHGFAPAVAAALAGRESLPGLAGPVVEFLQLTGERAVAMEGALGSLLQTLVVEDREAGAALRTWLEEHHTGKGAVALLPRPALVRLEALVEVLDFAGAAPAEPVIVGRRERLEQLRQERTAALDVVKRRAAERTTALDAIGAAETELRTAQSELHAVEFELRRAAAEEATRAGQRGRTQRSREDLERRRTELRDSIRSSRDEAAAARERRVALEQGLAQHRQEWQATTETLTEREAEWESVRDEEAELRVAHARAEGALSALERRLARAREEAAETDRRMDALAREEQEHHSTIEQIEQVRTGAETRLEELFALRDARTADVRSHDDRLAEAAEAVLDLETRVRALRRTAEERSEVRHRLELQRAEAESAERRIRERLEVEWARPFEQLVEEAALYEGDPELARAELQAVIADIERLGPINMLAMEEHEEESRRLAFLQEQKQDLEGARDDLQSAIRQINRTARDLFTRTFESIRENFQSTFQTLFEGGECDIRLEDPDDPLEAPIDISASPRGKRTQRIHLLSGGERALTALALLFAIYLVKPSPFCVLDEVDAPLDEANIGRFIAMLQSFKGSTQFIVITHNPRTMEAADWLYGVTMQEPGISSIVGVRLEEVLTGAMASG